MFVCDTCDCLDNTALGHYWAKDLNLFKDPLKNGKALCSACIPLAYSDGTKTGKGIWHNRFPQSPWDGKRTVINRALPTGNQTKK